MQKNDLAQRAMQGDLDVLRMLPDGEAYRWLTVAGDFGHTRAHEVIDDLLEASSLHDDEARLAGREHFVLACAYLTGTDGLPRDFVKGEKHLRIAIVELEVEIDREVLRNARRRMNARARAIFDAIVV